MSDQGDKDFLALMEAKLGQAMSQLEVRLIDRFASKREHDADIEVVHTKLQDHDNRLAVIEKQPPVTRQDLHDVKAEIAAVNLWRATVQGEENTRRLISTRTLAWAGAIGVILTAVATIIWLAVS